MTWPLLKGTEAMAATMEVIETFAGVSGEPMPEVVLDPRFVQTVWDEYLETAEAFNEPGTFTTIIGYEWTSTEGGNNLHTQFVPVIGHSKSPEEGGATTRVRGMREISKFCPPNVLPSEIDTDHPDLVDNLLPGFDLTNSASGIEDDLPFGPPVGGVTHATGCRG